MNALRTKIRAALTAVRPAYVGGLMFAPMITGVLMMTAGLFSAPTVGLPAGALLLSGAAVAALGTVAVMALSSVLEMI